MAKESLSPEELAKELDSIKKSSNNAWKNTSGPSLPHSGVDAFLMNGSGPNGVRTATSPVDRAHHSGRKVAPATHYNLGV